MPLSKARDRERKRLVKSRLESNLSRKLLRPGWDVFDREPGEEQCEIEVPFYNPAKHRPGDTVIVNGKVTVIPELDADGNVIPW